MQPNIVFLDEYSLGDADLGSIRALGNYTGYRTTVREEVADRCREADVVITNKVVFRRETLRQLPRLRLICVAATGMNHIDLEAAAELGIAVKNAVGYSTHAVTETTIGAAIGLLRQTVYYDRYVKTAYAGSPLQYHFGRTTHQLYGSKWGIVGLGNIGRNLVKRLQGFEPTLLGYDHFLARQRALNIGVTPTSIEDIFSQCDIITLHVPGGPSTHHMVNAELIDSMKDGAVLINTARGPLVNNSALIDALESGKLSGAGLDVFDGDRLVYYRPGEKPSAAMADLILPHLGANTREANTKAAKRAAEQMVAYFSDGDTSCVVNGESPNGLNPAHLQLAFLLAALARKAGGNKPIRRVECTFYGNLRVFRKWFTAPILEGLLPHAEKGLMPAAAEESLREHGIVFKAREPKDDKPYEDSITLDVVMEDEGEYFNTSVRGVVTEGIPMVSRLNNFNGLYADLRGTTLFLHYKDRPGIIATIGSALYSNGINIDNIAAPADHATREALAVLKTNKPVSDELLNKIAEEIDAISAFSLNL